MTIKIAIFILFLCFLPTTGFAADEPLVSTFIYNNEEAQVVLSDGTTNFLKASDIGIREFVAYTSALRRGSPEPKLVVHNKFIVVNVPVDINGSGPDMTIQIRLEGVVPVNGLEGVDISNTVGGQE